MRLSNDVMRAAMRIKACLLSFALVFGTGSAAAAQDASAPATYGSISLTSGFNPDPYAVTVTAGGTIQASTTATGCVGTIARAPDFELTYTAGSYPLTFHTLSSSDTTLVINGPDGRWYCDDDSYGNSNAEMRFPSPASGVYDVWVGSYSGTMVQATLQITELTGGTAVAATPAPAPVTPAPAPAPAPAAPTLMPDSSLTATYGEIVLHSGFTPDPRRIPLRAGGNIPAANVDSTCSGSIARAPDYQVTYTAGRQPLIIRTESTIDTTLVVNDPDGVWHCNDDTNGSNAEVNLDKPSPGIYDIWVGTFNGGTGAATLILTEKSAPTPAAH